MVRRRGDVALPWSPPLAGMARSRRCQRLRQWSRVTALKRKLSKFLVEPLAGNCAILESRVDEVLSLLLINARVMTSYNLSERTSRSCAIKGDVGGVMLSCSHTALVSGVGLALNSSKPQLGLLAGARRCAGS